MILFDTPQEIIQKLSKLIETERKKQAMQQKELALKADVPLPTYRDFLYKHKISLEALLKLLIALRLFENIESLLKTKKVLSLEDIKRNDNLPKRIDK